MTVNGLRNPSGYYFDLGRVSGRAFTCYGFTLVRKLNPAGRPISGRPYSVPSETLRVFRTGNGLWATRAPFRKLKLGISGMQGLVYRHPVKSDFG